MNATVIDVNTRHGSLEKELHGLLEKFDETVDSIELMTEEKRSQIEKISKRICCLRDFMFRYENTQANLDILSAEIKKIQADIDQLVNPNRAMAQDFSYKPDNIFVGKVNWALAFFRRLSTAR